MLPTKPRGGGGGGGRLPSGIPDGGKIFCEGIALVAGALQEEESVREEGVEVGVLLSNLEEVVTVGVAAREYCAVKLVILPVKLQVCKNELGG